MSGPTWSQWFGATEEADEKHDIAEHNFEAAQKWKKRAQALEQEAQEWKELYREARGNASGQRVLKELALAELAKVDPGNPLLDPANRTQPFDAAKEASMKKAAGQN